MNNRREEDHRRQMRNEKPGAVCSASETERHVWQIRYDKWGNLLEPQNMDGHRRCEACGVPIYQEGARWVAIPFVELAPWVRNPLVIQEDEAIEDWL